MTRSGPVDDVVHAVNLSLEFDEDAATANFISKFEGTSTCEEARAALRNTTSRDTHINVNLKIGIK